MKNEDRRSRLERLEAIGFRMVGSWHTDADKIRCELQEEISNAENVLYAFVTEDVQYIGMTVQSLRKRMNGYENAHDSQSTNLKCAGHIRSAARDQQNVVKIYALRDNAHLQYGEFYLNLAAGLERSLIAELKPKWNDQIRHRNKL